MFYHSKSWCVCTLFACCLTTKMKRIFSFFSESNGVFLSLWCKLYLFPFLNESKDRLSFNWILLWLDLYEHAWGYNMSLQIRLWWKQKAQSFCSKLTLYLSRIIRILMNIHGPKMLYWLWWAPDVSFAASAGSYSVYQLMEYPNNYRIDDYGIRCTRWWSSQYQAKLYFI